MQVITRMPVPTRSSSKSLIALVAPFDLVASAPARGLVRSARPRSDCGRRCRSCRRPGRCLAIRHRKSCFSSVFVGALNAVICTPCGSSSPTQCRMMPPLPAVSMPWMHQQHAPADSVGARASAYSRSCSSRDLVPEIRPAPCVASTCRRRSPASTRGSIVARSTGPGGSRRRSLTGTFASVMPPLWCTSGHPASAMGLENGAGRVMLRSRRRRLRSVRDRGPCSTTQGGA